MNKLIQPFRFNLISKKLLAVTILLILTLQLLLSYKFSRINL